MGKLLNSGLLRITGVRTSRAISLTQVTGQLQPFADQRRCGPDLLGREDIVLESTLENSHENGSSGRGHVGLHRNRYGSRLQTRLEERAQPSGAQQIPSSYDPRKSMERKE